jgi:hypothetical protein
LRRIHEQAPDALIDYFQPRKGMGLPVRRIDNGSDDLGVSAVLHSSDADRPGLSNVLLDTL